MEKNIYFHEKYVGSICMIILCVSGLLLLWINSWQNARSSSYEQLQKTKLLWKFEPASYFSVQAVAIVKLFCAGVMVSSLVTSILVKIFSFVVAFGCGCVLLVCWNVGLFIVWNLYFSSASTAKTIVKDDTWNGRKRLVDDARLPVTVVTGYLGSGKTTLIKRILNNTIGLKVLVIENEIGAEGIDHELLMQSIGKDEVVLLSNGCICCTVRSDLLQTFRKMFENEAFAKLDWIIIETTGLADPAPVIQSFYMDKDCQKHLRLDGVLTVVDSKHFPLHLSRPKDDKRPSIHGGLSEAILQVTYADRILLNKADIVNERELKLLEDSLKKVNPTASLFRCTYGNVDLVEIMNINAFNPSKLNESIRLQSPDSFINVDENGKIISSNLRKRNMRKSQSTIVTVSITDERPVSLYSFNEWISNLLQNKGKDILRMKGILSIHGYDEKFLMHGVHMIFDGERSSKWETNKRISRLVFIGINLDERELRQGFQSTLITNV